MAADMPPCYHGAISRKDCEDLMGKKNKDGAYLIRDSETIQGAMCLCVYKKKVVYTYRLLKTLSGQYTLLTAGGAEEVYFKSLDELVRHYKRKNQGLVMHLRHSVKRKTALLIRATTQIQNPRPEESHDERRPEEMPSQRSTVQSRSPRAEQSRGQRRPSECPSQSRPSESRDERRPVQVQPPQRGAQESRAEPEHGTDQSDEHEEVDYENLPDYVDVQPS